MRKRIRKPGPPLWGWSYNNPEWDRRMKRIHDSVKELEEFLGEKGQGKKKIKKR